VKLVLGSLLLAVLSLIVVSALLGAAARGPRDQPGHGGRWPFEMPHGWLRCEGADAVIITIRGKDYAGNGMASSRYAPIQAAWKGANYLDIDVEPIISRRLTLCHW
jgi:hypothetical protein